MPSTRLRSCLIFLVGQEKPWTFQGGFQSEHRKSYVPNVPEGESLWVSNWGAILFMEKYPSRTSRATNPKPIGSMYGTLYLFTHISCWNLTSPKIVVWKWQLEIWLFWVLYLCQISGCGWFLRKTRIFNGSPMTLASQFTQMMSN